MRWLFLLTLLACGDDGGDQCQAPAACYAIDRGPGTGTCDPDAVADLIDPLLLPFETTGLSCGPQVVKMATASAGCTADYMIEVTLTAAGPSAGTLTVAGDCGPAGADCESSYALDFPETFCNSQ